jgi:cytochrome c2
MIKKLIAGSALLCVMAMPSLAEGDTKAGKKVFKKCKACHSIKEGQNKVGPTLYNILDAKSGMVDGFKYSNALAKANLTWDAATLDAFLTKPKGVVPGIKMAFGGLKKQTQVDDLIAYFAEERGE